MKVVGCLLIDEVVQPVLIQQIGVAAPGGPGRLGVVIIGEVVCRHMDGQSGVLVPKILLLQGPHVVLGVAGDEDLPAALGRHGVDPGLLGRGEDFQLAAALDILAADARVPRVGHHEHIVESAHEHGRAPLDPVRIDAEELFGQRDENVRVIEDETGVRISMQEGSICISGQQEQAEVAQTVVRRLMLLLARRERIDKTRIRYAIELAAEGRDELIDEIMSDVVAITYRGKQIRAKTLGQSRYVNAMKNNTVVFGVGPAGTGKTYLAMAAAVMAFKNKEVSRIVLTRPAVEAGEKLGFLPGDLQHKVDPYLRPLYDAIYEMMGSEAYARLAERGVIEVAPLAYMRGRTLNDAVVILDEAQNTTSAQIKMFLTRMGWNTKMIVTGDRTQIDLPPSQKSGLIEAVRILSGVSGIAFIDMNKRETGSYYGYGKYGKYGRYGAYGAQKNDK